MSAAPDMPESDAAFLDDMAHRWRTSQDGPGWCGTERHITRLLALARLGTGDAAFAAERASLQTEIRALRNTLRQRQEDLRKFEQPDERLTRAAAALGGFA